MRIGKSFKWKGKRSTPEEKAAVSRLDRSLAAADGVKYHKVERGGERYHTDKQLKHRANHYVVFKQDRSVKCGVINCFLSIRTFSRVVHVVLIREQTVEDSSLLDSIPDQVMKEHMVCRKKLLANFMSVG